MSPFSKSGPFPGESRSDHSKKPIWTTALCGVWVIAIVGGMGAMMLHENTPGQEAAPLAQWPKAAGFAPAKDAAYTVVMLAHPRCPCTRASLHELARLNAQAEGAAQIHVLFIMPSDALEDWRQTPNWKLAASIPGVQVSADLEGRQAAIFGAKTSGQTLIYDRAGALRFSGGLTGSRGQEGDNPAFDAADMLIRQGIAPAKSAPVFGCRLQEESNTNSALAVAAPLKE